jgi:FG-GAP-like repeat/RTX calcium-binding nonapeptide repeat (4 copies)
VPFFVDLRTTIVAPTLRYYTHASAVGDFNGDGFQDLVGTQVDFGRPTDNPLVFLLGDGRGNFVDGASKLMPGGVPAAYHGREIVVADFNGDGRDDVFVAAHGIDTGLPTMTGEPNLLLLSKPGGTLVDASQNLPGYDDFSHSATAGDIDSDGDIDLFVGNFRGVGLYKLPYFLLNDGTGQFTPTTALLPNRELAGVTDGAIGASLLADQNGDGKLDLILGDHGNKLSRLYLNDGTGRFNESTRVDLPPTVIRGANAVVLDILSADFNLDGRPDLILTGHGLASNSSGGVTAGSYMQFLRNAGSNGYVDESSTRFPGNLDSNSAQSNFFLSAIDVNRDGHMDIFARNVNTGGQPEAAGTPYLWINDGTGHFRSQDFSLFTSFYGFGGKVVEPINADGQAGIDFIALDYRWALFRSVQVLGTGPDYSNGASMGVPGFNEDFYLNHYPDALSAVRAGMVGSGLAHFLTSGRSDGRVPFAPGTQLSGSDGDDNILLTTGNERVLAGAGRDIVRGNEGNDYIDGGTGLDTASYGTARVQYTLVKNGTSFILTDKNPADGDEGTDTLVNVERILFANGSIALDVGATQSGGQAQLLLGAVLGKDLLATKQALVGTGIGLFDQGFTMQQLSGAIMRLDIWGALANGGQASASNTQIANYLLTTVNKAAPSAATLAAGVNALNAETAATQGNFLWGLAESAANQVQVGLVGLATTGLEYV